MENEKEKTIIEVSTITKYNPEIIELLYDFTNGDKSGILKILSSINKNILLVKANFDAKPIEKSGFFYFAYDVTKNEILDKGLYAYRNFQKINIYNSWDEMRKVIFEFKSEAKFDRPMASVFERELASENFLRELKRLCADFMNTPKFKTILDTLLTKGLAPVFYNKNFNIDSEADMMDPFLFFKPIERVSKEEEEAPESDEKANADENVITLKVSPILDAMDGKTIREMSSADHVIFDLKDEREAAYYISELLQKSNKLGLTGKIQSYSIIDEDTIKLNIYFAPGISGEAIVPNTVRVRVLNGDQIMQGDQPSLETSRKIEISYKTFIKIVVAIIFIIIFFLLLNS